MMTTSTGRNAQSAEILSVLKIIFGLYLGTVKVRLCARKRRIIMAVIYVIREKENIISIIVAVIRFVVYVQDQIAKEKRNIVLCGSAIITSIVECVTTVALSESYPITCSEMRW